MTYGPNDLEPCGTRAAAKRHLARAEHCDTCGTEGRRVPVPSLMELLIRREVAEIEEAS